MKASYENNSFSCRSASEVKELLERVRIGLGGMCEECDNGGGQVEEFGNLASKFREQAFDLGREILSVWVVPHSSFKLEDYIKLAEYELREGDERYSGEKAEMENCIEYSRDLVYLADTLEGMRGACSNGACEFMDNFWKLVKEMEDKYSKNILKNL